MFGSPAQRPCLGTTPDGKDRRKPPGEPERTVDRDAHAAARVDFVHFFDYLVVARVHLHDWIGAQPHGLYTREYPFGLGSIRATLTHVADIEWGYVQRLRGRDYTRADSPFTVERYPTLPALSAAWRVQQPVTRAALAGLGDPSRLIEYVSRNFIPPRRTRTTAGGVAGQLLFHEVHHRAQVMAMLRLAGVPAQDLDYSRLMWERTSVADDA